MKKNTGEKRRKIWQRLVAMLLVVIIVAGTMPDGMVTYAKEMMPETSLSQASDGIADTNAGSTERETKQEPETKAAETKAPETQPAEPETKAPETKAPETKAPETKAPETKAPETKAPETKAPETKAPQTKDTEEKIQLEETQKKAKAETTSTEEKITLSKFTKMSSDELEEYLNKTSAKEVQEFVAGLSDDEYEIFQEYLETLKPAVLQLLITKIGQEEAQTLANTSNVTINITKTWRNETSSSKRPKELKLEVFRTLGPGTAEESVQLLTLTEADGWKATVSNLPATNAYGRVYQYGVREPEVPNGYESEIEFNYVSGGQTSTPTTTTKKETAWVLTDQLLAGNEYIITTGKNGTAGAISVSGSQVKLNGQNVNVSSKTGTYNGKNTTLTYISVADAANITKWTSEYADTTLSYLKNGSSYFQDSDYALQSKTNAGQFGYDATKQALYQKVSWKNTPVYMDYNGQFFNSSPYMNTYLFVKTEVTETVTSYDTVYTDMVYACDITNTYTGEGQVTPTNAKFNLKVVKKWDDAGHTNARPASLSVDVYQQKAGGEKETIKNLTLSTVNGWSDVVENLPVLDENGKSIEYGLKEVKIPSGYSASYSWTPDLTSLDPNKEATQELTCTLTNTYTGAVTSEITMDIVKEWDDAGHTDARPSSLDIELYKKIDDKETMLKTITLTAAKGWKATETLPIEENGKSIEYVVKENEVPLGYKSKITFPEDGNLMKVTCKITNTYDPDALPSITKRNPGKIQVTAQKYLDEKAPGSKSFTFKLKDEGTGLLKGNTANNDATGKITFDELQYSQTGVFPLLVEEQTGSYTENGRTVTDNQISYASPQKVQVVVTLSSDLSKVKNPVFCGNAGSNLIYLELNGEPMKAYSISKNESLPNAYYNVIAEPTTAQLANQTTLRKLMYFMDTNNGNITLNGKSILLTAEVKQNIVWAVTGQLNASEQVNGVSYTAILNHINGNSNPPTNYKVALAKTNGVSGQQVIAGYYKDRAEIDYICNVNNAVEINNYTKVNPPAADGTFTIKAQKLVDGHMPGKDNIFEFTLRGIDNNTKNISEKAKNNEKGEIVFPQQAYPAGEYQILETVDPNRLDMDFDTEAKKVTVKMSSKVAEDAAAGNTVAGGGDSNGMATSFIRVETKEYTQHGYCMRQGFTSPAGNSYVGELDPSEARLREIADRSRKNVGNVTRYTGTLEDTLKKIIFFASQNPDKQFWISGGKFTVRYNEIQQLIWYALGQTDIIDNGKIIRNIFHDGAYPGGSTSNMINTVSYIVNNTQLPANYHLIAYTTSNQDAQPIIAAVGSETVITYASSTVPVFNNKTKTETPPTGTTKASVEIKVKKYLDGGQPRNKSFKFILKNEQGQQIGKEVTNDSEGNVKFPEITYTQPGTYKYTIEEVNDGQPGIVYDKNSVREVTVEVTSEMIKFGTESTKFVGNTQSGSGTNAFNYTMTNGDYTGNAYCMNSSLSRPSGQEFNYVKNPETYSHLFKGATPAYVNLDQNDLAQLKNALYYFETEAGNQLSKTAKNEIIWALCCKRNSVRLGMVNGKVNADYNDPNYGIGFVQIRSSSWFNAAINTKCPDDYELIIFNCGDINTQPLAMLVPKPEVKTTTVSEVPEFHNETTDIPPTPENPEVEIEAQKTVDGERPGANNIFHFKLWDADPRAGKANLISEADNTADGKIVFPTKITKSGTYWIEEVVESDKYPNIEFDENRYQKIEVVSEATVQIVSDGKTTYRVGTNSSADRYEDLRIVVNPGEATEQKLQAYCIHEDIITPVNEDYHIFINPTDAELAQHTKGNAYVVNDLKKLLYFFGNPANDSITFKTKYTGGSATAYLDATRKQWLLWILTGSQEKGANAAQQYTQPSARSTDGVSHGIQPYATYQEVLDAILAQAPAAPANYQLLLAIQGSNINSLDTVQPIVAGFEPKPGLKVTYESSATSVTFKNKTKKTGEFLLQKTDGTTGEALSGAFKFTLKDKTGKVVTGYKDKQVDQNGQILFKDLPFGEYYIEESSCPNTYVKLTEDIKVTVGRDGVTIEETADPYRPYSIAEENGQYKITVKNYLVVRVPETGAKSLLYIWMTGISLLLAGMLLMIEIKRKEKRSL